MNKTMLFISFDPIEFRRRVLNQIETARKTGFHVTVISTSKADIIKQKYDFIYSGITSHGFINRGIIAYPIFNILLFFKLVFKKYDAIHFRGIIPIPAILFRQWFNKSKLIYDAHEYFRGHQIFYNRPIRKAIWMWFESRIIHYLNTMITVSEPLADLLKKDYPSVNSVEVIRSLPSLTKNKNLIPNAKRSEKIVIFHGYFLPGRALENIIQAMAKIKDDSIKFIIIGEGPLENRLKILVNELDLHHKITFHSFIENEKLIEFIHIADIGLTLSEPDSINRKYAQPNKFFEYIHAGLPILASNIPTLQNYIDIYKVGQTVDPSDIQGIARKIEFMLADDNQLKVWQKNCKDAALELNWEKEAKKLKQIYQKIIKV